MNHFVKAFALAALALLIDPSPSVCQTNYWQPVNGPHTGTVQCAIVRSNGVILAGTHNNSPVEFNYYRSTDNGETWEGRHVDPAARFAHEPRAFVPGPNGEIYLLADHTYRSTDDGLTWEFLNSASGSWFYTPTNGNLYLGSMYGIYESTDGGGSWRPVGPQYLTGAFAGTYTVVHQFAATNDGNFLAVSDGNTLWRSQNAQGWVRLKLRLNPASSIVLATDGEHSLYLAHRNRLYASYDNGAHFRTIKSMSLRRGEQFSALAAHPNGEIFVGTNKGRAFRVYTAGRAFRAEMIVNTTSDILSFAHNAATRTTVVGTFGNGVFLKNPSSFFFTPSGFNVSDVWSFARTTGPNLFALSQYSAYGIFRSTDEGRSWRPINTLNMGWVDLIGGTSRGYLFAMHCCGTPIRRSADNGATWINITDPNIINNDFNAFFEAANGSIYLGSNGGLFRSVDNGTTWTRAFEGGTGWIHQSPDGTLYAVSNGIITSADNGATWTQANNGLLNTSVRSIASNSLGWIFLATGTGVFYSTDAGGLWQQTADVLNRSDLTGIVINANDELFVSTGSTRGTYNMTPAGVFTSQDNGASWTQLVSGMLNQNIIALILNKEGHLIAASERGGLFASATSTLSSAQFARAEAFEQVPAAFELGQNFPNPFNPLTTIEFTLADEALVTLRVYNTLGQEVAVLAESEEFTPGRFQLDCDASALPSGVYYYRLTAHDVGAGVQQFASMKKMLLLK